MRRKFMLPVWKNLVTHSICPLLDQQVLSLYQPYLRCDEAAPQRQMPQNQIEHSFLLVLLCLMFRTRRVFRSHCHRWRDLVRRSRCEGLGTEWHQCLTCRRSSGLLKSSKQKSRSVDSSLSVSLPRQTGPLPSGLIEMSRAFPGLAGDGYND